MSFVWRALICDEVLYLNLAPKYTVVVSPKQPETLEGRLQGSIFQTHLHQLGISQPQFFLVGPHNCKIRIALHLHPMTLGGQVFYFQMRNRMIRHHSILCQYFLLRCNRHRNNNHNCSLFHCLHVIQIDKIIQWFNHEKTRV